MEKVENYSTEAERKAIIAERVKQGFILVEDQIHFDGKHLIFEKPAPTRDLTTEIDDLKARVEELEKIK